MLSWARPAALAALMLVTACASAPPARSARGFDRMPVGSRVENPGVTFATWTPDDYRYRIGPGDELAVRFLLNPDLNASVLVGPDGRGVFPLVSGQGVAGMTPEQAAAALTRAYGSVLRNPQVETLITSYGSSQIYVSGEVREPGIKPLKGQISVAQAVVAAGGFQETARTGKVVVLRQRPGDPRLLMRTVDVRAALKGADGGDFPILPGDLIFVPRSAIAEVNLFIRQYVTGALPFSFNYSINRGRTY
ncbi:MULTISPECIES: polysaccharide biosynthesis/export family protein [unclassified Caulobacter]|uniref:polysaccharide biosynthesis/export family protein n=1 Tax=unclassified Caulobacter TaxID=2648921 RepID=UPI001304D330|nr:MULTISPECIES: polysaccharide biosynthesis/export family protein [unclassified Caulobacter]